MVVGLDKTTVVNLSTAVIERDAYDLSVLVVGDILDFERSLRISGLEYGIYIDGDSHGAIFYHPIQFFLNLSLALAIELAQLCGNGIFQTVVRNLSVLLPDEQARAQHKQQNHTNRDGTVQKLVILLRGLLVGGYDIVRHNIIPFQV